MTRDELRKVCEILAPAGDSRAQATLDLIKAYEEAMVERNRPKPPTKADHAAYCLRGIVGFARLAVELGAIEPSDWTGLADDIEKLKAFATAPAARATDFHPPNQNPHGAGRLARLRGLTPAEVAAAVADPEAAAVAATREAHGLPLQTDPAVTGASDTSRPAGHYDKSAKMDPPPKGD